ncbi:MAG: D-aminoacyl-tRNA deacylase [Actinomycetaceae bacterium]|nr:D-aminoacyl-tRNA deacylase [Actinomycetaceae bacterium]
MKAVIQRALEAHVSVDGKVIGSFDGPGLVVLLGVTHEDGATQVATMVRKIAELKLTEDMQSAEEAGLPVMVISQFTLYGSTRKGRKPSWTHAAPASIAEPLYQQVINGLKARGLRVETGKFGAMMKVRFTNDGPFTVMVEC